MKNPPRRHLLAALFVGLSVAASAATPRLTVTASTSSASATTRLDSGKPFGKELEKRLAKAKLLETRNDGTKVYQEADGTKIYLGDHSVAIVSGSTSYGTVEFGTKPDGAATVRLGSIVAAAGANGEIMLSDEHSGSSGEAADVLRRATELKVQAKLMQEQATRLQQRAEEMKTLANKLTATAKTPPPTPPTIPKKALDK